MTCLHCGLPITGPGHQKPEDCIRHLKPRYELAQNALKAMHKRYRNMEQRLERLRIQEQVARKEAKRAASIPARLERLEQLAERWSQTA